MTVRQVLKATAVAGALGATLVVVGGSASAAPECPEGSVSVVVFDDNGQEQYACVASGAPVDGPEQNPTVGGTPQPQNDLPRTGSSAAGLVVGGTLVFAGVGASLVSRRRHPKSQPNG